MRSFKKTQSQALTSVREQPEPIKFNDYYENISAKLGILQVVLYLGLFAFVVLSFFRNTELITYQNFYYFFKDINASASVPDIFDENSVTYPTAEEQSFTLYRGGLAVAGENSLTLFTATGRQVLSETIDYRDPVAVGSGKYLLVYDLGGRRYSVYNSYARLYAGESEYPITGAAVSESGMYALISSSESHTSAVSLYNDRFSLINRYHKNGYVMDVSINPKGNLVAVLSSTVSGASFQTSVMLCEPGRDQAKADLVVHSSMGLECSFTSSSVLSVLCTEGILFVNSSGKITELTDFEGKDIITAELSSEGASLLLSPKSSFEKKLLIVFDKNGKMLYNDLTDVSASQISRAKDSLYLLCRDEVLCIDLRTDEKKSISAETDRKMILAVDGRRVLLCSAQKAVYLTADP